MKLLRRSSKKSPTFTSKVIYYGSWVSLLTLLPLFILGIGDERTWLIINLAVSLVTQILESRNGVKIDEN